MFHDRVSLEVAAGRGGDGSASFRREAHVPRGGPDGGDGGDGGDVILVVDARRRDLSHLRGRARFAADDGQPGARRRQHGARGEDRVIEVPPGSQVYAEDGARICDLTVDGQQFVVARGGGGGRGNTHFTSSTRQAPAFAEIGLPGDERAIEIRLKLLADVALVGSPNAGKSSLLRRISNAKPKVADYPFTTLVPVLGTVSRPDGSQFTVVDVPGLLEGAHEGHGLGHEFMAHLERVAVIAQLVPMDLEPDAAARDAIAIARELWAYDPAIARRPRIVVLSKQDLVPDGEVGPWMEAVEQAFLGMADQTGEIVGTVAVSSPTGHGLQSLLGHLYRLSAGEQSDRPFPHAREDAAGTGPAAPASIRDLDEYRVYQPRPQRRRWRIFRDRDGLRIVGEPRLKELAERANAGDAQATAELNDWLTEHGALRALQAAGMGDGTTVTVAGVPFQA